MDAMTGLALLLKAVRLSIPVPVALIVAALAWVQFDKGSAVRRAVNAKVEELAAGERIAAEARAREAAERKAADALRLAEALSEQARRAGQLAAADREAREAMELQLAEAALAAAELQEQLDVLLALPLPADCAVGGDLLDRLR